MQATSILKDEKLSQLLDPRLGSNYDHDQIERMVLAATLCIRREPQTRPRIGNVSLNLFSLLECYSDSLVLHYNVKSVTLYRG